jgi:hypothetical protein
MHRSPGLVISSPVGLILHLHTSILDSSTNLFQTWKPGGARATRGETNETACAGIVPRVCNNSFVARRISLHLSGPLDELDSFARRVACIRLNASVDLLGGGLVAPKKEEQRGGPGAPESTCRRDTGVGGHSLFILVAW